MARTIIPAPVPVPRLIPSVINADPAVLARESTAHADAILRQGDQTATAALAAAAVQVQADATNAVLTALAATVASITPGRLLRAPRILSGVGADVLATGTCVVHLRGIGQGGGGGGSVAGAAGAGGSSGALLDIWIGTPGVPLSSSITYAAGSGGGAGGNGAGTNGGAGADSTISIGGTTYTMKGGGGGGGITNSAVPNSASTHPPAAGTTGGGVVTYGLGGNTFGAVAGISQFGGPGGGTELGGGGFPSAGAGGPGSPSGFGGGGAGGDASTGGAGAAGGFVFEEYS